MFQASNYSAVQTLPNGLPLCIRALKARDRDDFISAARGLTDQSLRLRFFGEKRHFTEAEQNFFLNPDFISHVALIAVAEEAGGPVITGGARYVVVKPGQAEVAFAVADCYQGLGIGTALMRHLTAIAWESGLNTLIAEVLPDNIATLKVLERSGLHLCKQRDAGTIHVTLQLAPPGDQGRKAF
jgi:RimJ/RimL family protein N-acetyltransferase